MQTMTVQQTKEITGGGLLGDAANLFTEAQTALASGATALNDIGTASIGGGKVVGDIGSSLS